MRNLVITAVLIMVGLLAGRLLYYGFSFYSPPERPRATVTLAESPRVSRQAMADTPATVSEGLVVVDYGHNNALFLQELNVLLSKIVARGYRYEVAVSEQATDEEEEADMAGKQLLELLPQAQGLIIPLARDPFTPEEVTEIEAFVERGGHLLLIADPTRTIEVTALNTVAGPFDIVFVDDYLYNLERNDNNYRNVIFTDFAETPLTAGLARGDEIILYASSSVKAPGETIIHGDELTYSSTGQQGEQTTSPAALTTDGQVLALGDLTIFMEPHNTAAQNSQLINNIADFITAGRSQYETLAEFPRFFADNVDIVFRTPQIFNSQFAASTPLKTHLEESDRVVTYTNSITASAHDAIIVGRFADVDWVAPYLSAAGIAITTTITETTELTQTAVVTATPTPPLDGKITVASTQPEPEPEEEEPPEGSFIEGQIQISGVGSLERGGTTLFYLHEEAETGRNLLIMLSDDAETNEDAFELLLDEEGLSDCLVSPMVAVCQTGSPEGAEDEAEDETPNMRSIRLNKILVVADDDGRERNDVQTSAINYQNALSATYNVDIWETSERDGSPDLDKLQEYDAIIWSTGDYWDDSIEADDTATLTEYLDIGGNLLLSGASIGFDWDHTQFLSEVLHADYLDFAEQTDLELLLPDHPIADGFAEGLVITFTESPSGETLEPDVMRHLEDSRVIFARGPDSEFAGAASIMAYENERSKVAYFAFPPYMLTGEPHDMLIDNAVNWFTTKLLDPPSASDYEPFELEEEEDEESTTDEDEESAEGEETDEDEESTDDEESDEDEESTDDEESDEDEESGDEESEEDEESSDDEEADEDEE